MKFRANRLLLLPAAGILLSCCNENADPGEIRFLTLSGREVQLELDKPQKGTVVFFLSPSCPLCQNYTLTLNKLRDSVPVGEIAMIVVFPGKSADPDSAKAFVERYSLNTEKMILDPEKRLSMHYGATVTPEAVLLDRQGKILYRGRIDDWAVETGTKRQQPSSHDLIMAIRQFLDGGVVNVPSTKAVGCFIE